MEEIDFEALDEINFEALEEELAKIDQAELSNLSQLLSENVPEVKKNIKNEQEDPISEETKYMIRPLPLDQIVNSGKYEPLPLQNIRNERDYLKHNINLYDLLRFEGEESKGRRYIRWRFMQYLNKDQTPKFMEKIRENVRSSFYMRHVYSYALMNQEDKSIIEYFINKGFPWMNKLDKAEKWLQEMEAVRLDPDNIKRPNTKWKFLFFLIVDLKVVLDRKPLMGRGPLPDWLRNLAHAARGQAMMALDTYQDNLCLWRCIAVYRGARPDQSTKAAQGLAKSFFKLRNTPTNCSKTSLDELEKVEMHLNKGKALSDWLGIRVYVPERVGTEVVWHLTRNPAAQLKNIMTIGIFGEHAFLRLPYTFAGVFREKKYLRTILNATTTNYISVQSY